MMKKKPGRHLSAGMKKFAPILLLLLMSILTAGFQPSAARYTITVEGSAEKTGVIEYAGLEMNVYQDQASNPCGDCPDQPVSIYAGTDAADTAKAMAEAVRRADDIWEVESCREGVLVLKEKKSEAGSISEEPSLSAPEGLELTGDFDR